MIRRSRQTDLLTGIFWSVGISWLGRDCDVDIIHRFGWFSIVSSCLISLLWTASSWQISWLWRVSCGRVSLLSGGSLSRIRWFVWNSSDTSSHNLVQKRFKNAAWAHSAQSCLRGSAELHQRGSAESEDYHEERSVVSKRVSSAVISWLRRLSSGNMSWHLKSLVFF